MQTYLMTKSDEHGVYDYRLIRTEPLLLDRLRQLFFKLGEQWEIHPATIYVYDAVGIKELEKMFEERANLYEETEEANKRILELTRLLKV